MKFMTIRIRFLVRQYQFARWFSKSIGAKELYREYDLRYGAALMTQLGISIRRSISKNPKPERVHIPVEPPSNEICSGDVIVMGGEVWSPDLSRLKGHFQNGEYFPQPVSSSSPSASD